MHDNKTMFSYNAHEQNDKIISAFRALGFEVLLILIVSSAVLGVLNYFNIITISSVFPAISFLPQLNKAEPTVNSGKNIGNNKTGITNSTSSGDSKKGETRRSSTVEVTILEISTTGGTVQTKNGMASYEVKLRVRSAQGEKTFFYEKKDIPNITVFENLNDKKKSIGISDLKVGDKIIMSVSYDQVTKDLFSLIITRI